MMLRENGDNNRRLKQFEVPINKPNNRQILNVLDLFFSVILTSTPYRPNPSLLNFGPPSEIDFFDVADDLEQNNRFHGMLQN